MKVQTIVKIQINGSGKKERMEGMEQGMLTTQSMVRKKTQTERDDPLFYIRTKPHKHHDPHSTRPPPIPKHTYTASVKAQSKVNQSSSTPTTNNALLKTTNNRGSSGLDTHSTLPGPLKSGHARAQLQSSPTTPVPIEQTLHSNRWREIPPISARP